jgi:hypothetical protein
VNEVEGMIGNVGYYRRRMELAMDVDTDTVGSIVRLYHFCITNEGTNEVIYPEEKREWNLLAKGRP